MLMLGIFKFKSIPPTSKAINFEVGRAAYPIASSPIKDHPHTYLQYWIER